MICFIGSLFYVGIGQRGKLVSLVCFESTDSYKKVLNFISFDYSWFQVLIYKNIVI